MQQDVVTLITGDPAFNAANGLGRSGSTYTQWTVVKPQDQYGIGTISYVKGDSTKPTVDWPRDDLYFDDQFIYQCRTEGKQWGNRNDFKSYLKLGARRAMRWVDVPVVSIPTVVLPTVDPLIPGVTYKPGTVQQATVTPGEWFLPNITAPETDCYEFDKSVTPWVVTPIQNGDCLCSLYGPLALPTVGSLPATLAGFLERYRRNGVLAAAYKTMEELEHRPTYGRCTWRQYSIAADGTLTKTGESVLDTIVNVPPPKVLAVD